MKKHLTTVLWFCAFVLGFGTLFIRAAYPEPAWMGMTSGSLFLVSLIALLFHHRKLLQTRAGQHGLQSGVTAFVVILIVVVLNFLANRHPVKKDFTKNQIHTLSDQTKKIVRDLKDDVKFTVFARPIKADELKTMVDNYKSLSSKIKTEVVNPDRELTRAKDAGIKKDGTVVLQYRGKDSKIEEPTEEKLTNALIKILKDRNQTLCAITGHGEKNYLSDETEGYGQIRKELNQQSYEVKEINLFVTGKIPEECDALAITGPNKAFFDKELKMIDDYLRSGGRAVFAVDLNFRTNDTSADIQKLLSTWGIQIAPKLIVDPVSKMVNVEPVVAVLSTFSKDHPITAETQASVFFPFSRPVDLDAKLPENIKGQWLSKTMQSSWAESDMNELKSGAVQLNEGKDQRGPLSVAVAVEGKIDPQATRNARIVVFGTSAFATNYWARFGGNLDFYLNSVSWVLEDESLISIRTKSSEPDKLEMTQAQFTFTWLTTVLIIPFLTAVAGIVIWIRRKKL